MRGSEKQIKWAKDIIETVTSIFDAALRELDGIPDTAPAKQKNIEDITKRRNRLCEAEYAGDVINLFKDIRRTDDYRKDLQILVSTYQVRHPMTEGERKILCKE